MNNIRGELAPKATDIEYVQNEQLRIPLICRMDSYKFGHPFAYREGITGMASYGSARVPESEVIIPAGMQLLVKEYLTEQVTMDHIKFAEDFALGHFRRPLFDRYTWEKVVHEHDGYLPLVIRSAREGIKIKGGQPIYTVTAFDDFYWMSAAFETLLQRGVWYPTTVATMDYRIRETLRKAYIETGSDLSLLSYADHDFGGRGVTVPQQAENGGCIHTFNSEGSDTVEGVLKANFYYKHPMAAYSVFATEHSVECSFGLDDEGEHDYLDHQLRLAIPGSVISIVLDGKNVYRAIDTLCTVFKDRILASGAKVVFRLDSGDMMKTIPYALRAQDKAFGHTINSKGFKKITPCVGILQGDNVDHLAVNSVIGWLMSYGYQVDSVNFGSGGARLQKVNRDTFKMAQKASAIEMTVDGKRVWKGISKDPIDDPGKKSMEGVMTLLRHLESGEYVTGRLDQGDIPVGYEDAHQLVYHYGKLYNETTLTQVRQNIGW